jgi:hypothetical protein
MRHCGWAAAGCAIGIATTHGVAQCRYSVTLIEDSPCGNITSPVTPQAINSFGEVAGYFSHCVSDDRAFFWSGSGLIEQVSLPPGTTVSQAFGLNDAGWIVGSFDNLLINIGRTGFIRHGEEFINLPPPKGGNWTEALAINNSNVAVGYWGNVQTGPGAVACMWENGKLITL